MCSEIPVNFDSAEKSILDENGLLHVPAKKSLILKENGSIYWLALRCLMDKLDGYEIM